MLEYTPPAPSLMVQELPALVVIKIGNEGAKTNMCSVLGLLPLVLLQVDISQASQIWREWACGHTKSSEEGSQGHMREAVADVVGGMRTLRPP